MRPLRQDLPPSGVPSDPAAAPGTEGSATAQDAEARPARALSVVVPMKDEEPNVVALVTEICGALGDGDDEVVLVHDGSRDGTVREMHRAREQFGPRIRVIRHDRNRGQSTAICTGVRAASGVLIATLDGDGQNDPADIPRLVEELRAHVSDGVTMVIGERRVRHDSFVRRMSSRIANRVRDALLHDGVSDTGCGLKVFARSTFLELPHFDHMHRFLPALVRAAGGGIIAMPVSHRPRQAGRSKYGIGNRLWVGIVDLLGVRWLIKRQVAPHAGREETE